MNIVILEAASVSNGDVDLSGLSKYGSLTVYETTNTEDVGEIAERVREADIVLCNKSLMNRQSLEHAHNLKYIGLCATGYNNVDIEYTKERNIVVCNAASYSTEAVAQHVFAFLLNKYNRVAEYDSKVKEGMWKKSRTFSPFMEMQELMGKTIGIVGYGSIGKKVAQIAQAFDMKVLAYNRSKKEDVAVKFVDLDTLLSKSDIVTMHCPLNSDSNKMCDRQFFSKMKEGAYFINTSRGGVVDEEALVEALNSGHLSGAGLDVIEIEPMRNDSILCEAKNIVITPHSAWAPLDTRIRLMKIVEDNIKCFLNNNPINVVNR
ncbi:MAG: D-2-hydroxyacid dehydrogenase [Lachnospiraceae bacterium]|nr:D-2-hydroxyacid dehydrogenase [Lachnospiraceae bacterium]